MRRNLTRLAVILGWGAGVFLAVFGYNLWSYCCGRCTFRTLLTPGLPGYGLLALIAAAAATLAVLKVRRRRTAAHFRCGCGLGLKEGWLFCPGCGTRKI
ncbi:MAG: hypothetical protein P8Z70_08705 [Desulfuromonadales bacterium]